MSGSNAKSDFQDMIRECMYNDDGYKAVKIDGTPYTNGDSNSNNSSTISSPNYIDLASKSPSIASENETPPNQQARPKKKGFFSLNLNLR